MTEPDARILTVRSLRRRWMPQKERLHARGGEQSASIRFHRACSWIDRVENNAGSQDHDVDLISLWVYFNSLYGQWDEERRDPKPDRECWRNFVAALLGLDQTGHVAAALTEHKRLVMSLLEDEYPSSFFWQEPGEKRAGQSKKAKHNAESWCVEKRCVMVLNQLLERIYLLRCQLFMVLRPTTAN